jgi:streptogramin lyase/plastocyanin
MIVRYAAAVLIILVAGCSASHTANPTSALPGSPSFTSQDVVDFFNLSTHNVIHKYLLPNPSSNPFFMATGSDKNVWFTESNNAARIGKITPSGAVTEYAIPSGAAGVDIAAGAAGTLWFTECPFYVTCTTGEHIGKITTAGVITEFPSGCATGITKGPDGNMWFTGQCGVAGGTIGKITPTGSITEYSLPDHGMGTSDYPYDIVAGPDGNLWFGEAYGYVGKITTSGVITEYVGPDRVNVGAIAVGPDGNLYAPEENGIYKITTAGVITEFSSAGGNPDIILGPDKQMWMSGNVFGPAGLHLREFNPITHVFSPPIAPDGSNALHGLTQGSDGDVWIADQGGNSILVYEEKIITIGIRLNGELSFTDPNYGFELGYAIGNTTQTQTISLSAGESVQFRNLDTIPHSAAFLGNATSNSAPWPGSFNGSTTKSPAGTAIGTTGWATGSLNPNKTSPIYETGLPGFYMIGCQYHYNTSEMRTVVVVH